MQDHSETEGLIASDHLERGTYGSNSNNSAARSRRLSPETSINIQPDNGQSNNLANASNAYSTLTFHGISYQVISKRACSCKEDRKQILKNIHGMFKPGMNALMGPTGSGKTSLLDVLAGRKASTGLTGTILLDGKPVPQNFRLMVGYVAQDDVVTSTLTIKENLAFSATLRLPRTVSKEVRNERVQQVLLELGLTEVADTKVGDNYIRGVSGGERKRCTIGMELIISPQLMFLDEPTTGLDASTANAVMLQLRKLSKKGRTIIFSIHQPRYAIYRLFDSLMLLSRGSAVYHGPAMETLKFFESVGYVCDQFNNPADFVLDVINGDSSAVTSHDEDERVEQNGEMDPALLPDHYLSSAWWKRNDQELRPIFDDFWKSKANNTVVRSKALQYKTNYLIQLQAVSGRAIKNLYRNPRIFYSQFSVIIVLGLLVGGIYYQLSDSRVTAIQNRTGAFFLIIMNQVFGNMSAVELFIKERAIFIHENIGGFYRVSVYFFATIFCDVIPMRLIPAVLFSSIAYFMVGLRSGIEHFGFFALTGFATSMSSAALAFFFSSTVNVYGIATLCLSLCYVFMMIFSGFLINVNDLGDWAGWIKYLSIFRYSLNAYTINEFKDNYFCGNSTINNDLPDSSSSAHENCTSGNAYLQEQGIDYKTTWDLWWNIVGLGIFTVCFLFLSYIQLRRIKKFK